MATIKKRGDSYLIRVSCGYDVNGKHKEQSMTWKPDEGMTKKQIEKELNRQAVMFEESVNHGFKTSAMKFQELAEEWFENYAKNALRSTTYERMLQLTHRVYPAIGHLRIDKITARHLQGFVNSLAKEGANEKTGKPLAPKTIRHNLSFISDVFSYAVRMDLVSDNPCRKVTIPKGEVKEKPIYSQEEIAQLDGEEKQMFLDELGMSESGLDRLIKASYTLLMLEQRLFRPTTIEWVFLQLLNRIHFMDAIAPSIIGIRSRWFLSSFQIRTIPMIWISVSNRLMNEAHTKTLSLSLLKIILLSLRHSSITRALKTGRM